MTSDNLRDHSPRYRPKQERGLPPRTAEFGGRFRTRDLFGDRSWIVIEHGGTEYRLRITRLGKLILTK